MSDFVESAKNFVSSAVSRTSWEAQKQLRIHSKQSEIDKLLEQRQKLLDELTRAALSLYQQGALSDPQLSRLCASVLELDHDVTKREEQLRDIKNEAYPAEQFAPGPTTNYTPPPAGPVTGASTGAGPQPAGATGTCPRCGSALRPNALYCRSCGARVR
ncbi:MAG: zinc ribbon domain-containing protein [Ktedonobacteraceae bacterium]|nr:zinc ribbon domain-containing protein [Ktedonobacteraceae bacterium]